MKLTAQATLSAVRRATFNMPFTIVFGLALGGLLVPIGSMLTDSATTYYDQAFPVVEMSGTLISYSNNEAVIAIGGSKLRECSYVRMQAYSRAADGNMMDAFIMRVDTPESGVTRPVGAFRVGTWRVWPLPQSKGVVVYISHLCGSRLVMTKIVDIPFLANDQPL